MGMTLAAPATEEPVLLGSAILGSVAAGLHDDIPSAMEKMSAFAGRFEPKGGAVKELHDSRFDIFKRLQSIAREAVKV